MKRLIAVLYAVAAAAIVASVVLAILERDWALAIAWGCALMWLGFGVLNDRRADRWATAYVLAVGRNAGQYARGLRDGRLFAGFAELRDQGEE